MCDQDVCDQDEAYQVASLAIAEYRTKNQLNDTQWLKTIRRANQVLSDQSSSWFADQKQEDEEMESEEEGTMIIDTTKKTGAKAPLQKKHKKNKK